LDKSRLKKSRNQSPKKFNSLQSYVSAIWVKTRKRQRWFWAMLSRVEF